MTEKINSRRYIECSTNSGQIVRVTCDSNKVEEVEKLMKSSVVGISLPTTQKTNLKQGAYGTYSRFEIVQHEYGANMVAYRELLEIKDPIEGKASFVIYDGPAGSNDSYFTEWENLKDAKKAFKNYPSKYGLEWDETLEQSFQKLNGFIRKVNCGYLQPWFYAAGQEQIVGDYVIAEYLSDDPVYRMGRRFLVYSKNLTPSVKTCLGCRFINTDKDSYGERLKKNKLYRLVYFDDGTIWDETETQRWYISKDDPRPPIPLRDEELWVVEAMEEFEKILCGDSQKFSINFIDGTVFNGKVSKGRVRKHCEAGDYKLSVIIKGQSEAKGGWVKDFTPTLEYPDIVTFIKERMMVEGYEKGKIPIERIEILESKKDGKKKKWSGVFFEKNE